MLSLFSVIYFYSVISVVYMFCLTEVMISPLKHLYRGREWWTCLSAGFWNEMKNGGEFMDKHRWSFSSDQRQRNITHTSVEHPQVSHTRSCLLFRKAGCKHSHLMAGRIGSWVRRRPSKAVSHHSNTPGVWAWRWEQFPHYFTSFFMGECKIPPQWIQNEMIEHKLPFFSFLRIFI